MHGLGGVEKRRLAKEVIKSCNPDVLVNQKPKKEDMSCWLVKWIMELVLFEWCVVQAVGIAGGILCAWNPASVYRTDEWIRTFSISLVLKDLSTSHVWMFTAVYGPSPISNREDFWVELKEVKERWTGP